MRDRESGQNKFKGGWQRPKLQDWALLDFSFFIQVSSGPEAVSEIRTYDLAFATTRDQCDKMSRLFFNICPLIIMNICSKAHKICQSRFRILPKTKYTLKIMPNNCKILPKWQHFHQIWSRSHHKCTTMSMRGKPYCRQSEQRTLTKGGSITVWLTLLFILLRFRCFANVELTNCYVCLVKSKLVKQEVNRTVTRIIWS